VHHDDAAVPAKALRTLLGNECTKALRLNPLPEAVVAVAVVAAASAVTGRWLRR
jgi:hypothetical protein